MFGFFTKNNPGEKHSFTTRRGKKKMATINQVLGMPQMWSDASLAHAERMAGGMNANPIKLARTNPIRLAKTNPISLARTNPAGKTMTARYGGKCKMTGEEYEPGAEITKVEGKGWCLAKNV
jgi:hypothetical protein